MIHLCVWSNLNSVTFNLWFGHSTLSNWSKITRAIASANQMQNLNPSHVSHSHFSALQLVRLLLLRDLISLCYIFVFFCLVDVISSTALVLRYLIKMFSTLVRLGLEMTQNVMEAIISQRLRQRATSMHMRVVVSGGHQILVPKATYVMQTVDTGI